MRMTTKRSNPTTPLAFALIVGLWLTSVSLVACGGGQSTDPEAEGSTAQSTTERSDAAEGDQQLVVVEGDKELAQADFGEEASESMDSPKIVEDAADDHNADPTDQPNKDLSGNSSTKNPSKGSVSNVGVAGGGGGGRKGGSGGMAFRRSRGGGGARARTPEPAKPQAGEPADLGEAESDRDQKQLALAQQRMMGAKQGELWARPLIEDGEYKRDPIAFPLKSTQVHAEISGFIAQTSVTQNYENPFDEAIEATYVFPLPEDSAVNGYTMTIGTRVIRGFIRKKAEAKEIYEEAKRQGYRAALLEQERPNIFVQNIANIAALEAVSVELSFMNRLKREGDTYSWHFPMTVGPRFNAEAKIDPSMVEEGQRTGNNISLSVELDAGLPINAIRVPTHEFIATSHSPSRYTVEMAAQETIPNKDFVLEFDIFGADLNTGYAVHADGEEGFVSLMFSPPRAPEPAMIAAREIIMLIDCSGSMRGEPLQIVKTLGRQIIEGLRADDSFNLMRYSGSTERLWESSRMASSENRDQALSFLNACAGGGGTNMDHGISETLKAEADEGRVRSIALFTDGFVGNEDTVLGILKQRETDDTRVFAFGIGSSVNRFLLEQIGKQGRGHTEIVLSADYHRSDAAVTSFMENIATPVLTDIELEWQGVNGILIYPETISDLYADKPISIVGRYDASQGGLSGTLLVKGMLGGQPHEFTLEVDLPALDEGNPGLSALWARERIEALTETLYGMAGEERKPIEEQIVETALAYNIVSKGTSFVAVDDQGAPTSDGDPKRVKQGSEVPEGVDAEGISGE